MIDILFFRGSEIAFVRIEKNNVRFADSLSGNMFASLKGLKLNYEGVIKEYPNLMGKDNWREEVVKRFNKKIKSMKDEEEISDYVIEELEKFGYELKKKQKAGFRPEVIKWMAAIDSLVTVLVLLGLFLLAYCRIRNKTLVDVFNEVREMFSSTTEEVLPDF